MLWLHPPFRLDLAWETRDFFFKVLKAYKSPPLCLETCSLPSSLLPLQPLMLSPWPWGVREASKLLLSTPVGLCRTWAQLGTVTAREVVGRGVPSCHTCCQGDQAGWEHPPPSHLYCRHSPQPPCSLSRMVEEPLKIPCPQDSRESRGGEERCVEGSGCASKHEGEGWWGSYVLWGL